MARQPRTNTSPVAARVGVLALLLGWGSGVTAADGVAAAYPNMGPMAQYLAASPADEIALARSAAPATISRDAEILTLGSRGYETAVAGKNPFVCIVERSWANNFDNAGFWNPKFRAPHCFNAAAARSVLPTYLKRTEWVLAGLSKAEMLARTQAALAAHQVAAPELGSMAYMMSTDGYLGDDAGGHWHPHVMFYLPRTPPAEWGANLKGSPVIGDSSSLEPLTIFVVPVARWSDGTPDEMSTH